MAQEFRSCPVWPRYLLSRAALEVPVKYRTLTGLEYAGKRVEVGQVVEDIPESSVGWLRSGGFIEQITEPTGATEPEKPKPAKRTTKRSA